MTAAPGGKRGRPSRRVRLEDLAARCEVSVATVSRALSGGAGVRPDLVARIQRAAQDFGYSVPSTLAGLRLLVLASPAAMADYARSQFTLNVMHGIENRAALLRADLVTRAVTGTDDDRRALEAAAADDGVAGLLFLTLDDEEMLAATRGFPKPVVLVNGDDPLMRLSSVAPSNRAAGALATDHLMRLRDLQDETGGFQTFIPLAFHPELPELAAEAIRQRVLHGGRDFTAILAAGDSLAMGAMQGLAALGLRVPRDVSVMGMDGLPQGSFLDPPLSVLEMPMEAIGATAVDLLRDLRSGPPGPARRIELACRLTRRGSCGPPPEGGAGGGHATSRSRAAE